MSQLISRVSINDGEVLCGIDGAPPAAYLSDYAWIQPAQQLRSLIVPETYQGHRQWGFEPPSRALRMASRDRSSLRHFAEASISQSGRPTRMAIRAGKLAKALTGRPVANLVCHRWFTPLRNAFGSHVLQAIAARPPDTPVWFYTLMPAAWRMPISQLPGFRMSDIVEPLRVRLYDAGLDRQSGWVIASLHGEHLLGNIVHPHLHVVVVGEKVEAFEALHDLRMFKGGDGQPVRAPIARYEPANLPRQIGYLFQPDWTFKTDDDEASEAFGERTNRRRPPELNHARYLLWRAQQRLTDVTWMHGIRLQDGVLVPK